MSDTDGPPPSVTATFRIDPRALAVLEWYARYTGTPLRRRIRESLEAEAVAITERYGLDYDGPMPAPIEPGDHQPAPRTSWRTE